jgi:hypothetical protein
MTAPFTVTHVYKLFTGSLCLISFSLHLYLVIHYIKQTYTRTLRIHIDMPTQVLNTKAEFEKAVSLPLHRFRWSKLMTYCRSTDLTP